MKGLNPSSSNTKNVKQVPLIFFGCMKAYQFVLNLPRIDTIIVKYPVYGRWQNPEQQPTNNWHARFKWQKTYII